ncbi:MAG: PPC domain-containing DNA-binding protein, partial [Cyanobacteria bacterium J06639_1]
NVIVLRLKPAEDLKECLQAVTTERAIAAGIILTGIGSLERAALRLAGSSSSTVFDRRFEIVSLSGTLSPDGLHVHVAIADETGQMLGGHLVPGCQIATTAEIAIGVCSELTFSRPVDDVTGFRELAIASKQS